MPFIRPCSSLSLYFYKRILIISYGQPCSRNIKVQRSIIHWVNEADPYDDNPGITLERANQERTVYLINDDDAENLEEWISLNFMQLFESELEGWYTDESLWPKNRNRKLFDEWFNVECHSVIVDTVGSEIFDDEI
jgi:hypothetical protein